jgi:hypothetical protein
VFDTIVERRIENTEKKAEFFSQFAAALYNMGYLL